METMRRVLVLVACAGLLGAFLGCHTTSHGVCDCELQPIGGGLHVGSGAAPTMTVAPPLMSADPARAMPKAEQLPKPVDTKDK
jgi:hypothetical protein